MTSLEYLFRLPQVDTEYGMDLSPDGTRLAFSSNKTGTWEIFEIQVDGSNQLVQLTSGPGGKFNPHYSCDGCRLAFAFDSDGSENYQIKLIDLDTLDIRTLICSNLHAIQPKFSWSPNGVEIAVLEILPSTYRVGIYLINDGKLRDEFIFSIPPIEISWSPTGNHLAVQFEDEGSNFSLAIIGLMDKSITWISMEGEKLNSLHPAWSPEGNRLAFCCDKNGFSNLYIYILANGSINLATAATDTEKTHPTWFGDGNRIACIEGFGAKSWVATLDLGKGEVTRICGFAGIVHNPIIDPTGEKLFVICEDPVGPPDLWEIKLNTNEFHQLTYSIRGSENPLKFPYPQEIHYPGLDGEIIPAILYKGYSEDESKPGPAVIVIHGGPDYLFQMSWNPLLAFMASLGWVVLAPNYRGSRGYGEKWLNACRNEIGKKDSEDVIAGAQYLIQEKIADPPRIALTGRSHGGYLTMTCLTMRPELWCAGSAIVPVLNLFTSHRNSRPDLQHWNIRNYGDPVEHRDTWIERSPYFHLDKINAPVQFICGDHDVRCPASEAKQAHQKLLENGNESEINIYPNEGHTFLKLENIIKAAQENIDFLEKHLFFGH